METIYHRSDFDFILPVTDAEGNAVGWPSCDWEARLTTEGNLRGFTAGCVGGVCRNCVRDGDSIRITAGRHGLPPGRVRCEFSMTVPDSRYPGGVRRFADVYDLDIRLTDEPGAAEVSGVVRLPVAAVVSGIAAFCDLFSAAAGEHGYARMDGGRFDCELNGLRLTYEEAVLVYEAPRIRRSYTADYCNNMLYYGTRIRTHMPLYDNSPHRVFCAYTFMGCAELETVAAKIVPDALCFHNCRKLREIDIEMLANRSGGEHDRIYENCSGLREIRVNTAARVPVNLRWSPLISHASFLRIIAATPQSVSDGGGYPITVHPDVFTKLTDEANADWHAVLEAAAEKGITFASA
ncbi:MAG: hypothetical protein K2G30_01905 [Muribaculaceae bacterium]|nr:hypothetical protein [Muribaculaceae bacterium]MDE7142909.1 hypothetical protein [Muribaculaceae bacterium]